MLIAGVQMDVAYGDVDANLDRMAAALRETASRSARLVVFPECAATGYCCESLDEARSLAQPIPGPIADTMLAACRETGQFAIFGTIEADGDRVFNAAVLAGPDGIVGSYRKVHLPFLGLDRFASFGDRPFAVHEVGGVRVGTNICYDSGFPESSRIMALQGADLIALPTNWPHGSQCLAEHAINTRALENNVYYIAVNRVGVERGTGFIGRSRICDPGGQTLAVAGPDDEEILYAEIDPERARNKLIVRVPETHMIDRLADRRPEMYGLLTEPHTRPRPGRGDE